MDQLQRTRRFGICVILCACILRLTAAGMPDMVRQWLTDPDILSFLIYLETGRNVRFSSSSEESAVHSRESPPPWIREEIPDFGPEDMAYVEMTYGCSLRPDLETLLQRPLNWDLTGEDPSVLILHTHTTESYTKAGEKYTETSRYRTLDEKYNMLSIGDRVARILEENGIGVIHDREIHDYPSYNGSYVHARSKTEEILKAYPSIRLVLDLHRDASEAGGKQLRTQVCLNGTTMAQLMLVVGTDVSRQSHENWEENLSLALKLHVQLQRRLPGIMRPVNLRSQRFNQDLSTGALIVEVGAAGNTHAEALAAAEELAQAVAELAGGVPLKAGKEEETGYFS